MSKPAGITEETLQTEADKIVDEALAPWRSTVSPMELSVMRFLLLDELLVNPDGRLELRRSLGDLQLEYSGEVPRTDDVDADRAAGEGDN